MEAVNVAVAQAVAREESLPRLLSHAVEHWWPGWNRRNANRRLLNQINVHDDRNPLQARLLVEVLRDTGDDEIKAILDDAHREGRARKAERDRDRAMSELERERRRMRTVPPRDSRGQRSA